MLCCREGCCGSSLHQSQVGRGKRLRDISNKSGTEIFRYTLDVPGVLLLLLLLVRVVLFQLVLVVLRSRLLLPTLLLLLPLSVPQPLC